MDQEIAAAYHRILGQLRRNAGYLARQEIDAILEPIRLDTKRLEPYGFKVYSQNEEDGIIEEIFRRLNVEQGRFCEIGVESGLECNSLYLIHKGWRGCWIEGNPKQRDRIEAKFASLIRNGRLRTAYSFVTAENINQIVKQALADVRDLDFFSIDVDGNDIYLMEAMEFFPKVICIEYNSKFPWSISKKPVYNPGNLWKGTDFMGASLLALSEVASKKGYNLVATNITGSNAFFVRNDCLKNNFRNSSSIEHLYNPPRYWLTLDHFGQIGHPPDFGEYVDLM